MLWKGFLLAVFFFAVPVSLGIPWTTILPNRNRYRMLACLPVGYFIELAIFHFLAVPFGFLGGSFRTLSLLFGLTLAAICTFSIFLCIRKHPIHLRFPRFSAWEWAYLLIFCTLLGLQLYNGLFGDQTYWTYDDAGYVTSGEDAVRYDMIQRIDPNTGIAITGDATRILQSSLYFPAFLTLLTGTPVSVMSRTVLECFDILLGYTVYAYLASVLFEKKENGLIFLIILSILHIYGYYSQYSITFRLLGPNYQGKGVHAVSLLPLTFTLLMQKLEDPYEHRTGILLMLLSAAAVGLSMFGAVTYMMDISLVLVLALFRGKRHWKHLWYLVWGGVLPALYVAVYYIYRTYRW